MACEVDFVFFRDEYGGDLEVDAFAGALPAALRHVCWLCGGFVPGDHCEADVVTAWRRAICAAVECFAEWGEGQTGGVQIGDFKVTHYDNRGTTGAEQATAAVLKELTGTGLVFIGAGR